MRDGRTREMKRAGGRGDLAQFLDAFQVSIVMLTGEAKGTEYALDQQRITLGRGPGVDLAFEDPAMSREHAVIEWASGRFRLRDLESTNGTLLNGAEVTVGELKHGDRFQIGKGIFQFVTTERERTPSTWQLPGDD